MKAFAWLLLFGLTVFLVYKIIHHDKRVHDEVRSIPLMSNTQVLEGKKVFYIDSYHPEYPPGLIQRNITFSYLDKNLIQSKTAYLNAKKNSIPSNLKNKSIQIVKQIEDWKPDLIIAADDAACKWIIGPYYKDKSIPVVFLGVNWDASQYGFPCSNVTGQVEVELIEELITQLKEFSKGKRIGFLSGNTITDRKALSYYKTSMGITFHKEFLVNNFTEWQKAYIDLQKDVDILILRNTSGIKYWNPDKATDIIYMETKIPTGTVSSHLGKLTLISYAKSNREFGLYAAQTAVKILKGTSPVEIPISKNIDSRILLNMRLAKRLNIKFPMKLINRATFVKFE